MVNQAKTLAMEDPQQVNKNITDAAQMRSSMFVKVTMDGIPIGRKIDLNAHQCYESLSNTLEDMFLKPKSGTFFYVALETFAGLGLRNDECFCNQFQAHKKQMVTWKQGSRYYQMGLLD